VDCLTGTDDGRGAPTRDGSIFERLSPSGCVDALLHVGPDHPRQLWIVVPSMVSFLVGLVAFVFWGRIREWIGLAEADTE